MQPGEFFHINGRSYVCSISLYHFTSLFLNFFSPENVSVAIVHHWLSLFSCFCSNVLAGHLFGIPLRGTHSHAYVSSYMVSKIPFPLLLMNKSYYICNNVLSLEHLTVPLFMM